jgi:hypothetical protein
VIRTEDATVRTVVVAVAANLLVAVAKGVAAALTGSAATQVTTISRSGGEQAHWPRMAGATASSSPSASGAPASPATAELQLSWWRRWNQTASTPNSAAPARKNSTYRTALAVTPPAALQATDGGRRPA